MQQASEKLSVVVSALESEVRERNMLDHQFAAAIEQEQAARHASLHDALTGMPNRALFNDRLEHGFAQAKRHGWTLALMFVDLDDFKKINDQYGHEVGDSVLRTIARRLQENTRSDDTVSRHGGDEFLYLAMGIQEETDISLIAEKIIREIQAPINVNVRDLATSLSVRQALESRFSRNTALMRIRWSKARIRLCTGLSRISPGIHLRNRCRASGRVR